MSIRSREPESVRRTPRRGTVLALPLLAFGLSFAGNALAYLDPGTGSILVQSLIAATAAAVTWASVSWQRTRLWLRSLAGRAASESDSDEGGGQR
jgi:hypothetical protein